MFYKELTFHIAPYVEDIADALIAALGNIGYDSFAYTDDGFQAYIPADQFREETLSGLDTLAFLGKNPSPPSSSVTASSSAPVSTPPSPASSTILSSTPR